MWSLALNTSVYFAFLSSVEVRLLDLGLSTGAASHSPLLQAGGFIGYSTDANDDYLVVGAPFVNEGNGAVIGFEQKWFSYDYKPSNAFVSGTSSDGEQTGPVGRAVAVMDDVALVGMPFAHCMVRDTHINYCGRVTMYDIDTGKVLRELLADDLTDGANFGYAITTSDDKFVVGAPSHSNGVGRVWIYSIKGRGSNMAVTTIGVLSSPDESDGADFGAAIAFTGENLFVGSPGSISAGYGNAGLVHIYFYDESLGGWTFLLSVGPSNPVNNGRFGASLSADGNFLAVGSVLGNGVSSHSGTTHVYTTIEMDGITTWALRQVLYAHDGVTGDYFGCSVAVSGSYIAVGACNEAGKILASGKVWQESDGYLCGDTSSSECTPLQDAYVLTGNSVGAVYIYKTEEQSGPFKPHVKILGSRTSNSFFGYSLSFYSNRLFIGAPGAPSSADADVSAVASGAIYLATVGPTMDLASAASFAKTFPLVTGGLLAGLLFVMFIIWGASTTKLNISARAPPAETSSHALLSEASERSSIALSDLESSLSLPAADPTTQTVSKPTSSVRVEGWRPRVAQ